MDLLDALTDEQLLLFFRCNKTTMSNMENPDTFLRQLKDRNLIPKDRFEEVIKMKSKKRIEAAIYGILEWIEENRSEHIRGFWKCVSEEVVLKQNPAMKQLCNNLLTVSLYVQPTLPDRIGSAEKRKRSGSSLSVHEDTQAKRSAVQTLGSSDSDEEQPGPSSHVTQFQRNNSKKTGVDFPFEKENTYLPVTCGEESGKLDKERFAKGEKCIVTKGQWLTPVEFEKLAGKESCRKWKSSIRCMGTTLGERIEEGCLKAGHFPRSKSVNRSPSHYSHLNTEEEVVEEEVEEEEVEEEIEQQGKQLEPSPDHVKNIFEVRCADSSGFLHKKRFASGSLGKSIRTDRCWMTPKRFVRQALGWKDASWKTDIMYEGKPLSVLIEGAVLQPHPLMCRCRLCSKQPEDLEVQNNDDECSVCGSGEGELLRCGRCPTTFHQRCHYADDAAVRKNEPWVCNLCVFKANEEQLYSDE